MADPGNADPGNPVPPPRRGGRRRDAVEARLVERFGWGPSGPAPPGRARVAWRIDPGRRTAAAMVVAVLITAGLVGGRLVLSRPRAEAVPRTASVSLPALSPGSSSLVPSRPAPTRLAPTRSASTASGSSPAAGQSGAPVSVPAGAESSVSPSAGAVVVDVVGRVRHPGLVRLPAGARVDDAIRAAGGARAGTDLSTVNLARVCVDGEQISVGRPAVVPSTAPPAAAPPAGPSATTSAAAPVNLNTATVEGLETLPGIGPVMAQRIIDWRTTHGPFTSVDQLRQVSGIGDVTYARLSPLVTL